jgi:hypothetical protein
MVAIRFLLLLWVATPLAANGAVLRVPQDVASLQTAIAQVANGGIIEMAAGTY